MRIDQYLPSFVPYDAISNHALQVRRVLRQAGYDSEIWAEHALGRIRSRIRPYRLDRAGPDRLLLYHAATNSPMAAWLAARADAGEPLLVDYHNITPGKFFARWEPAIASSMERARDELTMLAPRTAMAFADSAFNEAELVERGYRATMVVPVLVDLADYHRPADPDTLARLRRRRDGSGTQWLFVGRVAPNKCQHDVIGAFAAYRRLFDPAARLTLVGATTSPRYRQALEDLVARLELGQSVELASGLSEAELLAHWSVADVFVCLSEHEGFCVPLLEAMELGVPVVAYGEGGAVADTLGPAGCKVADKDAVTVARAVHEATRPGPARDRSVAAGRRRAEDFSLTAGAKILLAGIEKYLAGR